MLERRRELAEQGRELGKLRLAGAERRRARALEAGEPILDVHRVVGAALLAVIDHVDAGGHLPGDDIGDRRVNRGTERSEVLPSASILFEQQPHHLRRPRQAARVGGENPVRAALHGFPPRRHIAGPSTGPTARRRYHRESL